jgi:hypothetical protein
MDVMITSRARLIEPPDLKTTSPSRVSPWPAFRKPGRRAWRPRNVRQNFALHGGEDRLALRADGA